MNSFTPKIKQRRSFTLAEKLKIVDKLSNGISATKLAREYQVNESTIRHMRKREATIRMAANVMTPKVASGSKRNRNLQISKTDACLSIWLDDMRSKRLPISSVKIKCKALKLYEQIGQFENFAQIKFSASSGWLENFKVKYDLKELRPNKVRCPPNESEFIITTKTAMSQANITNDQIFAVDNVAFKWKYLPGMEGENQATLLFCCNATGNFITPPVLYCNEAADATLPTAFIQYDTHGAISTQNMRNWFYTCFAPRAEKYLSESNLSEKAILLLAFDPNHPKDLVHHTIDITIFPPDCNSSCLPTSQGIVIHLNAVYLKRLSLKLKEYVDSGRSLKESWDLFSIDDATEILETMSTQLDSRALRNGWTRLLNVEQEKHSNEEIIKDTVAILRSIGLNTVTVEKLNKQIIPQELTNEEIFSIYLQNQNNLEVANICSATVPEEFSDEVLDSVARSALIAEVNNHLTALDNARKFVEQNDHNKLRGETVSKRLKQIRIWMREMQTEILPPDPMEEDPVEIKIEPVEFSGEMYDSN